jgi:ribosomal protein L7/L12
MNGQINIVAVNHLLNAALADFSANVGANGTAAGEAYRNLMYRFGDIVERAANADIDVVAYDVIDRDMVGSNVGTVHKIRAIKDVRTITMSGLKEAKEAVERAIGAVLRDRANDALKALAEYNSNGDGYHKPGYRQYVSAVAHRSVLNDVEVAAETPPF